MKGCRSCGAEVFFTPSAATGRRMILDAEPTPTGYIALVQPTKGKSAGTFAAVLTGEALETARAAGEPLYTSHHATCPQADQWRRRRAR
jgi:hypothetical protein